ncbi:MAG: V-type ATP synthase subunit K, partial [Thermoplasmata archaeon]
MVTLGTALAIIGAGLAVGLSAIGSGVGVGIVGAAGIGVSGNKPEKFGRAILFSAIPQTQAIYGLLVAIIILLKTGVLFRNPVDLPLGTGIAALAAGVSVGFAGLSAIGQGVTASAGVNAIAEDDRIFGRAIVFSVVPETQAIYGLLMAIIILMYTGFLGAEIKDVPVEIAIAMLGAALSVGIAGTSAIGQGITAASGINAVMKNEGMFGRALVFSVLSETHAIFGLLIGFLI